MSATSRSITVAESTVLDGDAYALSGEDIEVCRKLSSSANGIDSVGIYVLVGLDSNMDTPFQDGNIAQFINFTDKPLNIVADMGVTIHSRNNFNQLLNKYDLVTLIHVGENEWLLTGDIAVDPPLDLPAQISILSDKSASAAYIQINFNRTTHAQVDWGDGTIDNYTGYVNYSASHEYTDGNTVNHTILVKFVNKEDLILFDPTGASVLNDLDLSEFTGIVNYSINPSLRVLSEDGPVINKAFLPPNLTGLGIYQFTPGEDWDTNDLPLSLQELDIFGCHFTVLNLIMAQYTAINVLALYSCAADLNLNPISWPPNMQILYLSSSHADTVVIADLPLSLVQLVMTDCGLTEFDAAHIPPNLLYFTLDNNTIDQPTVDAILEQVVNNNQSSGFLYLAGLPTPSAPGLAAKATLQSRSWTVITG